ncbi:hypothetical protein BHU72_05470 [Desulfuribacillus stibiiarsenatis]|uniref:EfeO-type cupredoxin-like domain-containing protein n=1 Tax=Desulfuribacillus stibiiarsenatis TaxID=1390249 RepID=A0A1E5L4I5_9FIRM|nr:cupredoxin domain-containing protein [Desulfuribacillus stibiiarsenatis]OEH85060.1 hypothetical protein BHU72_05470 [Desulfuribacillus stibiiarsenatis]
MRMKEFLAGAFAVFIILVVPVGAILGDNATKDPDVIDVYLRAHEKGGFSPSRIVVQEGQLVKLRLISEDVSHGFSIGELGVDSGRIKPGEIKVIEFIAEGPGEYGYVCNIICSPLHAKIRGTLIVQ